MDSQTPAGATFDDDPPRSRESAARRARVLAALLIAGAFVPTMIAVIAGTATLNEPGRAAPPMLTGPPGHPIIIGTGATDQAVPDSSGFLPSPAEEASEVGSGRPVGRIVIRERQQPSKTPGSSAAASIPSKPYHPTAGPAVTTSTPTHGSSSPSDPSTGTDTSPSTDPSTDPTGTPTTSVSPSPAADVAPSVGGSTSNGATSGNGATSDVEPPAVDSGNSGATNSGTAGSGPTDSGAVRSATTGSGGSGSGASSGGSTASTPAAAG